MGRGGEKERRGKGGEARGEREKRQGQTEGETANALDSYLHEEGGTRFGLDDAEEVSAATEGDEGKEENTDQHGLAVNIPEGSGSREGRNRGRERSV